MILFSYIYWAAAILYIIFILICYIGWIRTPETKHASSNPSASVSIIIPARNEEKNILNCLKDISSQAYPPALYEVIIVDDHSTDHTAERVKEFIAVNTDKTFRLIQLNESNQAQTFKKLAITRGIEASRAQLIITTDADCRFSTQWIASILKEYEASHASMIAGPVCFEREHTFIEKIQSLEFMGLIGISAGSIKNNLFMLCNGANLSYSKNTFQTVHGFDADDATASGDDIQLMHKLARNNEKIRFLKSKEAIVYTSPKNSFTELISQRKRWASKIPRHTSLLTVCIAAAAYLLHAGILASAVWMLLQKNFSLLLFLPFAGKSLIEFIFLFNLSGFFNKRKLLLLFLPAQLIYPFYILIIGTIAPFGTYYWKERKVK